MANCMEEAFAPAEERHRENVLRETWGHLAPGQHRTYRGNIIIAYPEYGSGDLNPVIIQDNMGVENSPWWYEAIHNFIDFDNLGRGECGAVIKLNLTFRNYRFWQTGKQTIVKPS